MYQGINDNYKNSTTNFVFELQYHTPESWGLKKDSHVIYEKFRICQNPADLQKLFQEGVDLASSLPIPEGVENIPTLLKNPEPNLLSAYAYVISQNVHGVSEKLQQWFKEKLGEKASVKVREGSTLHLLSFNYVFTRHLVAGVILGGSRR